MISIGEMASSNESPLLTLLMKVGLRHFSP
nr:MAG TPA: hypothetical protein [Caudoviricetes sp.]